MTITTKPKGVKAISGYKVIVRNGEAINFSEVGAPEGTTVLVEDLFYNTPARKKFLKKLSTELARVMKVVIALAFAHNHISFKLISNKREFLATKGTSNLLDTIIYIYGVDFAKKLLAVEGRTRLVGVKGYLSLPSFNRSNAEDIFIFINNRYVYSKEIIGAIKEAYGTLLPRDRYPIAFLKLEIDNLLVDVNVHPTKSQVRFSHEREVYESIVEIIKNALRRQDLAPKIEVEGKEKDRARFTFKKSKSEAVTRSEALNLRESRVTHASVLDVDRKLRQTEEPATGVVERNLLPEMQLLGQLGATYIVAKTERDELILIDQHAAHERILYEQISNLRDKDRISQELVTPITLNLDSREKLFIVDCLPFLEEVGFKIEEFSGNTLAVTAVPFVLGKLGEPKVIHDIIADVLNEETKVKHVEKEAIIRIIACRGAIKSGAQCTEHQLQRLLTQLYRVNNPYTCPHGRPVMITLDKAQLDKMFKRN
jgi:DNA mismatch repair protein MutL